MVLQVLKVPQVPFVRVVSARSMVREEVSRPEPVSVPRSRVRGTDRLVYQGPPARVVVWPLGPVESGVIVTVSEPVWEELLVATICLAPGLPVAPVVQA